MTRYLQKKTAKHWREKDLEIIRTQSFQDKFKFTEPRLRQKLVKSVGIRARSHEAVRRKIWELTK